MVDLVGNHCLAPFAHMNVLDDLLARLAQFCERVACKELAEFSLYPQRVIISLRGKFQGAA